MSKKKGPARGVGQIIQGEILPTIEIDCSESIANPQEWTRGPVRPITVIPSPVTNKQPRANGGKKRGRR